jgi:hypothetical protein
LRATALQPSKTEEVFIKIMTQHFTITTNS